MKNIIDALQWRYATQLFDPQKKLTPAQLTTLTEAMRLSASSFGLQPWKFIVVTNPAIRTKLREAAYNQPKVTDASHFIVLAVQKNIDTALIDKYVASTAKIRGGVFTSSSRTTWRALAAAFPFGHSCGETF